MIQLISNVQRIFRDSSVEEVVTLYTFDRLTTTNIDIVNRLGILDGINLEVFTYPMVQDPTRINFKISSS